MKKNILFLAMATLLIISTTVISHAAVTQSASGYIGNTGVRATGRISKTELSATANTTASKTSDLYVQFTMKYKDEQGSVKTVTSNWYTSRTTSFPKKYAPSSVSRVTWCDAEHRATYGGQTWIGYTTTK